MCTHDLGFVDLEPRIALQDLLTADTPLHPSEICAQAEVGAASEGLGFREPLLLEGRQGERIGATISAALDGKPAAEVVPLRGA